MEELHLQKLGRQSQELKKRFSLYENYLQNIFFFISVCTRGMW